MLRFITQRLIFIAFVLVTIIFAVTWGMRLIERSPIPEERQSVWEVGSQAIQETGEFFGNALRGDLGTYELYQRDELGNFIRVIGEFPVTELLRQSFVASMGLLGIAGVAAAFIGVVLGIFVGVTRIRGLPFVVLSATVVGVSIPSFFAATMLQNAVIVALREYQRRPFNIAGYAWDYHHLFLPALVLAARPIAYLMRTTYIVLDRTLQEDYVRTAHSKGLSRRYVINVHALRNVAVPILTAVGVSWRFSLGILPIVEYMFAWPGLGLRILESFQTGQTTTVVPLAAVFGLTLLLGNLVLDVLYRVVDPRVRESYG